MRGGGSVLIKWVRVEVVIAVKVSLDLDSVAHHTNTGNRRKCVLHWLGLQEQHISKIQESFRLGFFATQTKFACNHCYHRQTLLEWPTYLDIVSNDIFRKAAWHKNSCSDLKRIRVPGERTCPAHSPSANSPATGLGKGMFADRIQTCSVFLISHTVCKA